jgi:signal transduction histidine kinase
MKLRSYLIALIAITIAPLLVVIVGLASWMVAGEREKEMAAMRRLAVAVSGSVDAAIGQRLVMAQVMATAPALVEQGDRAAFEALARRATTATRIDVLAADRDGMQFVNTMTVPGEPIDAQWNSEMVRRIIEGGRPALVDVQPSTRHDDLVSAVVVPTRGPAGEDLVVAVRIEPERLAEILPSQMRWRNGFATLFDGAGRPIALTASAPDFARLLYLANGFSHEPRLARLDESGLHAELASVGNTGWNVAVVAPNIAIAEALQRTICMLALAGAAGVLMTITAAAVVSNFLLREARTLVAAAEGVAEDVLKFPECRVKEVEVLRRALLAGGSAMRGRAAAMLRLRAVAENAALLEERILERTRELEMTVGLLLNAQDEERRRIARDIHDSTVQELIATSLILVRAEAALDPQVQRQARAALTEARTSLHRAQEELRTVSFILQPPLLDECGLAAAIQIYAEGFATRTGILVAVAVSDLHGEIPRPAETALFRVVQEALANVHRHSGARSAIIRLWMSAGELYLRIEDNGRGMPIPSTQSGKAEGVGIPSMRARLRQLGGNLNIRSASSGTLVTARLPWSLTAQILGAIDSSTQSHSVASARNLG